MNSRFPSFYVVGAAKSGTTALWVYFQQHPELYVTEDIRTKELGFFANEYGVTDEVKYKQYFSKAKNNQIIGEVCHAYLTSLESAERIKKSVPDAKIIIVLRNPIDRAYSLYNWMVMEGYENSPSFEKALKLEKSRIDNRKKMAHSYSNNYHYYNSGLYFEQVNQYMSVFDKKSMLVIAYEDLLSNELHYVNKIFSFLGVSHFKNLDIQKINKSKSVKIVQVQYVLRKLYNRYYSNRIIRKALFKMLKWNTSDKSPNGISKELRSRLQDKYYSDVASLSKLCDYNFTKLWFE